MQFITKESAFKIFYYIIFSDGVITPEEIEKLDEIGAQIFEAAYSNVRENLLAECRTKIEVIKYYSVCSKTCLKALEFLSGTEMHILI